MRRWKNGGGLVAASARVDPEVFVGQGSFVSGNAVVSGNTVLTESTYVMDNAYVKDSMICGSTVKEDAVVQDSVVRRSSVISGLAKVIHSNVDRVRISRFSYVLNCKLSGGFVQADLVDRKLKNCKVL